MTRHATAGIRAWHFSTGSLAHGDGRLITAGATHTVDGPIIICSHGLHGSIRALDALGYASSDAVIVARTLHEDDIQQQPDKIVSRSRTYLAVADVSLVLHEFACRCAESALKIANVTDERSLNALHVKREWIAGKVSDAELAAAREAAWAAAGAASEAAGAAAWAAWAAAGAAARAAARAASDAAWAASEAAGAAAWAASEAAGAAARAAARAAAWAAAGAHQHDLLESMLREALGLTKTE